MAFAAAWAPCTQPFRSRRPCGADAGRIRCQAARPEEPEPASRRSALAALLAAPTLLASAAAPAGFAAAARAEEAAAALQEAAPTAASVDTTVTDRLVFELGLCPEAVRTDRTLGDKTPFCSDPQPLGRLVVDLYGRAAPGSVANLVAAVRSGAYDGTALSKVLPGRYLVLGTQGPRRSGMVQAPEGLPPNPDILSAAAFRLPHRRPGTVSLNLSENEDEEFVRLRKDYRNLSLLVTTGPGPVPSLDGENIVVGQVAEGLDVIAAVTQVPTFAPNDNARAFNDFARFIGDDRAQKTRAKWGRPLQAVIIVRAGVV